MNIGATIKQIFGTLPEEQHLPAGDAPRPTNAHVHLPPNFGSITSIAEVIKHATQEGIAVLGTCNYYDHTIYTPFAAAARAAGIAPVFGIEVLTMDETLQQAGIRVNDPQNAGKIYICGKGLTAFDAIPDNIQPIWEQIRQGDKQRITAMIAKLNALDIFRTRGIVFSYEGIAQVIAAEKQVPVATVFLQERHLAQAIQRAIFEQLPAPDRAAFLQALYQTTGPVETENIVKVQDEVRNALLKQGRAAYVAEAFVRPQDAAALILGLGGYVSYPTLIDGAPQILPGEGTPEALRQRLLEQEIGAAEFIPTRNDPAVLTMYVRELRQQGIVVAAGTEHNAATWLPLIPACKKGVSLSAELTGIFWEGACVAVAHQYLRARGQAGFRFLSDVAAREAQLQSLFALGARVVACLRTRH
jgi:hypothetical protein